jgi:hypothetical protein
MTTKLIAAVLIAIALFGGWNLFLYWEKVKNEEHEAKKQVVSTADGQHLPGLPPGLETTLQGAKQKGAAALGAWLKTYGDNVKDPRKAWIELDYVMLLSRENPAEARKIFASVKSRVREGSAVYPRVKELEKTYQ